MTTTSAALTGTLLGTGFVLVACLHPTLGQVALVGALAFISLRFFRLVIN